MRSPSSPEIQVGMPFTNGQMTEACRKTKTVQVAKIKGAWARIEPAEPFPAEGSRTFCWLGSAGPKGQFRLNAQAALGGDLLLPRARPSQSVKSLGPLPTPSI